MSNCFAINWIVESLADIFEWLCTLLVAAILCSRGERIGYSIGILGIGFRLGWNQILKFETGFKFIWNRALEFGPDPGPWLALDGLKFEGRNLLRSGYIKSKSRIN